MVNRCICNGSIRMGRVTCFVLVLSEMGGGEGEWGSPGKDKGRATKFFRK